MCKTFYQKTNDKKIAERATIKIPPHKAFSIDFSSPLSAGVFTKVFTSLLSDYISYSYKITSRKLSKVQIKKTAVTHTTLPHNKCISEMRFLHLFNRPEWIVSYSQIRNQIIIKISQVKRCERRHNVEGETDGRYLKFGL